MFTAFTPPSDLRVRFLTQYVWSHCLLLDLESLDLRDYALRLLVQRQEVRV